ncbi:hypothetical protein H310_04274 [Aphanomyces invadans]|uniref:ATPase F1/V1/A1 complex alpha/beta subunit nucleotide-binding domain-containing protein n=1 Tax=Aphanomyces invadans TaxID=157072 RepID=A0A024UHH9_9STRA|nr:hypothetical protein H310_04274 [Aphanomyces invadans]ETW05322.1 hypothetical protein H310_04274 [Aphanomyces invadans]|eukprot:XP_008866760.1 hypothetical protein H310_04274 [Aphanomyces invadans]
MNGLKFPARVAAAALARRSVSRGGSMRVGYAFRAVSTYGYADAPVEAVKRSNVHKKSAVEVQLEEAITRDDDELSPTGILLALTQGVGTVSGLRDASLNSTVHVFDEARQVVGQGVVLHLQKKRAVVAFVGDASRLSLGMEVELIDNDLTIPVGANLLGRVVDPLGRSMDDAPPLAPSTPRLTCMRSTIPSMLDRGMLKEPWATGIQVIDCLHPLAYGHRFGILGPRGSGKTRLALDILAQQVLRAKHLQDTASMPRIVYVAVGKAPARVTQILQLLTQLDLLPYCTIVAADDRQPLIMQYLAPFAGCRIAESWLNEGVTKNAIVVYDDLSAHTMAVEQLIHMIKLPKAARLSFSGHTNLMERSTQFSEKRGGTSLTSLVLADTPGKEDAASVLQEGLISIVDDHVVLDASLTLRRVYPAIDCLAPGTSVRGPPFQRAALWKCMQHIRATIIEGHTVQENVALAKGFGFDTEPEDQEILDSRELVQEFFVQRPFHRLDEDAVLLGAFVLAHHHVLTRLPQKVSVWDAIHHVQRTLPDDLKARLDVCPRNECWSDALVDDLYSFVVSTIRAKYVRAPK